MFPDVGGKAESLHVKVMKVKHGSKARQLGVHTQMYLKTLSLSISPGCYGEAVFIGGDSCRKQSDVPNQPRPVDLEALINLVDGVLTSAYLGKQRVKLQFVHYKY